MSGALTNVLNDLQLNSSITSVIFMFFLQYLPLFSSIFPAGYFAHGIIHLLPFEDRTHSHTSTSCVYFVYSV